METKMCTGCGVEKLWTIKYFKKDKSMKNGLSSKCKECDKIKRQKEKEKYFKEHSEEIKKKEEELLAKEEKLKIEKPCSVCRKIYPTTSEYFVRDKRTKDGLASECKKCKAKSDKEYRKKNNEFLSLRSKEYYRKNPIPHIERARLYSKNNREERIIICQRHEAKKRNVANTLTLKQWKEIKSKFNNRCAYCGQKAKLEVEHIVPLSKGGGLTPNNIVPSCPKCNDKKHTYIFLEWYRQQEFYSMEREKFILNHMKEGV